ncbi:dihydroneopterin aldolase [Legionella jordanis]|uniref:7,8-dihydroneopterin aldolase n=1 Tax=Legionella jordanis TaxID=456 RepID=A0A0W0V9J7_9GAMM|nr:dihydroneopterin aldolase [Legionella jordanis]KTD16768.1 dihydroneopterin aldolase [Legionella jordanis]RMX03704.1 dihydroneopterin aldolase [Legionella jordanis]RMX22234.1 dihydroneopterin aldolase [Legionella jordanis]VEH11764.1 dihydroneopterin aldolase [Legionella jordanis]HAT8712926.1 dihydroneopterin aldolase [Legionella jordanis]
MDLLQIKNLQVNTRIGVHDWEQQILQRLSIDVSIPIDCSTCNDDLGGTIDYAQLCTEITAYVESSSFHLIETAANCIAERIKANFNISQLTVSVSKPHAIKNAGDVRVTITR